MAMNFLMRLLEKTLADLTYNRFQYNLKQPISHSHLPLPTPRIDGGLNRILVQNLRE
jgi:hypothetical protein